MEETFQRYEYEFQSLLHQIQQSIQDNTNGRAPGPSSYSDNLFQQADDLIKQMALEARSASDGNLKQDLLQKVRKCKSQVSTLQNQWQHHQLFNNNNNNAGDDDDDGPNSNGGGNNKRLLPPPPGGGGGGQHQQTEDLLVHQNDTLERARRTMLETEQVALEITEELSHNRDKLMSAHGRVREVSSMTSRARRLLNSMSQRAVQQKMIMYGVSIGLVIGFLILLYSVFTGRRRRR